MAPQLDQLPVEVLLHVFSFIPARALLGCIALVCRKFHELLGEEWAWRKRFIHQCGCSPLVVTLSPYSLRHLQLACVHADFIALARDETRDSMKTVILPGTYW